MYPNLIIAMKTKGVTISQLANLLHCRNATVSDKLHGKRDCGFYFEEAERIKEVFFDEYEIKFLFTRNKEQIQKVN